MRNILFSLLLGIFFLSFSYGDYTPTYVNSHCNLNLDLEIVSTYFDIVDTTTGNRCCYITQPPSTVTYSSSITSCTTSSTSNTVNTTSSATSSTSTAPSITSSSASTTQSERGEFGSSPLEILDNVVRDANTYDPVQDTALDSVTHAEGSYPFAYRLANTFDSIRKKVAPYLDWMFYIGLSVAVILLIWQGLQLVIGKTFADIRKPIINIVTGVVVLTGVYLIIKLITSVVALIFNV